MSLQSTDPIADLLTRIRNAILVGKNEVRLPTSKLKRVIATQLMKSGYLHEVALEKKSPRDMLVITISPKAASAHITELKRISKPGRRVYSSAQDIPKVKSGRGVVLVSTSKGVLTGREAQRQKLGGELILEVY